MAIPQPQPQPQPQQQPKSVSLRQPLLMCVTGMKGVGKTFRTFHFIQEYMTSNPETGKVGRKVLIFDPNMEYNQQELAKAGLYYPIRTLGLNQVRAFSMQTNIEARRILPINSDGTKMNLMQIQKAVNIILADFATGLIVIDDINKFMLDIRYNQELVGKIISNRHQGQDILLQYQSLAKLDTTTWQNLALIRFHHQTDDIARYKDRITDYDLVKIGQILVDDQYNNRNIRFYCYIDKLSYKISGDFTLEQFLTAVRKYINTNYNDLLNFMRMEGMDLKDRAAGVQAIIRQKYMKYYGNRR